MPYSHFSRPRRLSRAAAWCALILVLPGVALALTLIGPPRVKPDVTRGATLFAAQCQSCHGGSTSFGSHAWKKERTPEWVASAALGLVAGHRVAVQDAAQAWHVSAYVWTRAVSPASLRRGLELAEEGKRKLERQSAWQLMVSLPQVRRLQDPAWVLSRPDAEVRAKAAMLDPESFEALSESERQALVDYIYASFFNWPDAWAGR